MEKTILIIDDELDLLSLLKIRLEGVDYKVLSAPNAEEALGLLEKNKPDLILLDLLLPKMQGEEVCQRLKSDRKLKHIPVIIMTAHTARICETVRKICADDVLATSHSSCPRISRTCNIRLRSPALCSRK